MDEGRYDVIVYFFALIEIIGDEKLFDILNEQVKQLSLEETIEYIDKVEYWAHAYYDYEGYDGDH